MSLGFVPCTGYASAWHVVLTSFVEWVERCFNSSSVVDELLD